MEGSVSMAKPKPVSTLTWCTCGHTSLIHGLGGCEGVHTPLDGPYTKIEDCTCKQFKEAGAGRVKSPW